MRPIRRIIYEEAHAAGVSVEDVLSKSARRVFSEPRHRAMYRARHELGASYLLLARIFSRDHKTVHEAVKKQEAKMSPHSLGLFLLGKQKGSNNGSSTTSRADRHL